jgi:hypothetical protein
MTAFISASHLLQESATRLLVGMLGAGGVHEDVGVDQDHGRSSAAAGTDSLSISSGLPTGGFRPLGVGDLLPRIPPAGVAHSRLGAVGAVVLTAAIWSFSHQYDVRNSANVFLLGLLLGAARLHTGSVLLTVGLHGLGNFLLHTQYAQLLSS